MSRTITLSDELYARLEAEARRRGLRSIEHLLDLWQTSADELVQRAHAVQRIDALRTRVLATYGEMPDSTALIQEDRAR